MGALIDGIGTSTLEIQGVDRLSPVEHDDRAGPDASPGRTRSPP